MFLCCILLVCRIEQHQTDWSLWESLMSPEGKDWWV